MFSWACLPTICHHCWSTCSNISSSFLNEFVGFLSIDFWEFPFYFWIKVLNKICWSVSFLLICSLSFSSINNFVDTAEVYFWYSQFAILFYGSAVCIPSEKSLPIPKLQGYFPMFSFRMFVVFSFAFRFIDHCESFLCIAWEVYIFWHMETQVLNQHLLSWEFLINLVVFKLL